MRGMIQQYLLMILDCFGESAVGFSYHLQQWDGHIPLDRAVRSLPGKLEREPVELPELVVLHKTQVERR